MEILLERKNKAFHFEASNESGNIVSTDANEAIGGEGKGARPMELLVMAVGSCSAIDIASILTKQKSNPTEFRIKMTAEREGGVPSTFKNIHAHYILEGEKLDPKKVHRAIKLSVEKYCSVGLILAKSCTITWSYEVNSVLFSSND